MTRPRRLSWWTLGPRLGAVARPGTTGDSLRLERCAGGMPVTRLDSVASWPGRTGDWRRLGSCADGRRTHFSMSAPGPPSLRTETVSRMSWRRSSAVTWRRLTPSWSSRSPGLRMPRSSRCGPPPRSRSPACPSSPSFSVSGDSTSCAAQSLTSPSVPRC